MEYYAPNSASALFYDIVENHYRPVAAEVAFYLAQLNKNLATVLELGCGTARIGWQLAKAGHQVTGVDQAPALLERAAKQARFYPPAAMAKLQLLQADITSVALGRQFDLVLAPYRVFDHMATHEAQQQFLRVARAHLQPGAAFVFDSNHPTQAQLHHPERFVNQPPLVIEIPHLGARVERSIAASLANPEAKTLTTDFRYHVRNSTAGTEQTSIERLTVRWNSRDEIRAMLAGAGFSIEAEYSDFAGAPAESGEDSVWLCR